jgi:hypothetical protein
MTLLDSLLDPHPEDPAVVDGVRKCCHGSRSNVCLLLHRAKAWNAPQAI